MDFSTLQSKLPLKTNRATGEGLASIRPGEAQGPLLIRRAIPGLKTNAVDGQYLTVNPLRFEIWRSVRTLEWKRPFAAFGGPH